MKPLQKKSIYGPIVKTSAWREGFLAKIAAVHGFEEFVANSRNSTGIVALAYDANRLSKESHEIVGAASRDELTAARHYYNNAHLLGFWRMLNTELQRAYNTGTADPDFPLFQIEPGKNDNSVTLSGVSIESLKKIKFDVDEQELLDAASHKGTKVIFKPSGKKGSRQSYLNKLLLRLSLLIKMQNQSMTVFYNIFLKYQCNLKSPIWDYYRIHYFLDNFLYVREDGHVRRSHYDYIFGNTSLYELKLYLQYCLDHNLSIRPVDVEGFLKRQRERFLKLALEISLEENEIHNHRKDLLAYDAERGIVRALGITQEMIDYHHKKTIEPYGIVKQNGCPFALSRGVSGNALIESFEHFDKLMAVLLKKSKDFQRAFRS